MADSYSDAGFEEVPLAADCAALPYVIKSPSLYEYIDELLRTVHLDAAIIPIRELNRAASSRMVVERDAMHRAVPWLADNGDAWDTWSWSPGGAVFSLHPVDQARVLAVGFHELVERLVRADVPMIFLSFPRIVLDADYLFRALDGRAVRHDATGGGGGACAGRGRRQDSHRRGIGFAGSGIR